MVGGGGGGGEEMKLEYTPTWVMAVVCSVIVFISLVVERLLHFVGKYLKKKKKNKPLFEALQKVKEELMLLGFISLLLTVLQGAIQKVCIPESWTRHMLPCEKDNVGSDFSSYFQFDLFPGILSGIRRLLAGGGGSDRCTREGKVPLLSLGTLHDLHIFIFVLAVVHVALTAFTIFLGGAKTRQWKHWEDSIQAEEEKRTWRADAPKFTQVGENEFIRKRFKGFGKDSALLAWLHSFGKQFYGSVTRSDYTTMRLGFIMLRCRGIPKFNFHRYMVRALEADFKKVVGISWYLWFFVVMFMLPNVHWWEIYFWISFVPLLLLLALGAKLEHVITQLAHEVAEKQYSAIEGYLVATPSDDHFWFNRPRIVLYLIHFILFQNAFEIAYFFFVLTRYGFHSCIMGRDSFTVIRLVIGVVIQLHCSYTTLPLYAIATQMGSSFKKAIFDEHVQQGIGVWTRRVRKKNEGMKVININSENMSSNNVGSGAGGASAPGIQLQDMAVQREALMEEGKH